MNNETFKYKSFEKWLKSKSVDESVGCSGSPYNCPFATYLKNIFPEDNYKDIAVTEKTIHYTENNFQIKIYTPTWVQKFIGHIDKYGRYTIPGITAGTALVFLNNVRNFAD